MPHSLTIHPPQAPSFHQGDINRSQATPQSAYSPDSDGNSSPTAPEYSPITPKVQPALPVNAPPTTTTIVPPDHGGAFTFTMAEQQQQNGPPPPRQQHPPIRSHLTSGFSSQQQQQQQHTFGQNYPFYQQPEIAGANTGQARQMPQIPFQSQHSAHPQTPVQPLQPRQQTQQRQQQQQPLQQQSQSRQQQSQQTPQAAPAATFIPQPPTQPFSSADSTDALALRAAISTLQYQRRKAQDDLRELARIKALAITEPQRFQSALSSGELREKRPALGDLNAITDFDDSDDDNDDDDNDDDDTRSDDKKGPTSHEEGTGPFSNADVKAESGSSDFGSGEEGKNQSRSSHDTAVQDGATAHNSADQAGQRQQQQQQQQPAQPPAPFPPIPGAQNIVRMPYVNWDKYGIVGAPLDAMHAQQQRWPGSSSGTAGGGQAAAAAAAAADLQPRGREYVPAAPYSPFLDTLLPREKLEADALGSGSGAATALRKDSAAVAHGSTTVSEHPMETRSRT